MDNHFRINAGGITYSHSRQSAPPDALNNNHCHDTYEILYVAEGSGLFVVEGNEFEIHSGSLVLTKPYKYHFVNVERSSLYERYVIHFSLKDLPESLHSLFSRDTDKDVDDCTFFSAGTVPGAVVSTLARFDVATSLGEEKRVLYLSLLLSEILVLLSDTDCERKMPYNSELGARVIRYLNDHIDQNVSLDHIAKHFFVSKYYLCRAFKKHNGISIHGYITQKRVMLAKLLIESGEPASSAAYRVGFGDYSAFYRAYIKILGISPVASRGERRDYGIHNP